MEQTYFFGKSVDVDAAIMKETTTSLEEMQQDLAALKEVTQEIAKYLHLQQPLVDQVEQRVSETTASTAAVVEQLEEIKNLPFASAAVGNTNVDFALEKETTFLFGNNNNSNDDSISKNVPRRETKTNKVVISSGGTAALVGGVIGGVVCGVFLGPPGAVAGGVGGAALFGTVGGGIGKAVREHMNKTSDKELVTNQKKLWILDKSAPNCMKCTSEFTPILRKHHCRACGGIFCRNCCKKLNTKFEGVEEIRLVRVCVDCTSQRHLQQQSTPIATQ